MSLRTKFRAIVAGSAIGLVIVAVAWIWGQHSTLLLEKSQKTRDLVELPYSIITQQYQLELQHKISRAEAQQRAIEVVQAMRYDGSNYFWINDDHPTLVVHPMKPELNGTDLSGVRDPSGKAIFVEFVKAAQSPDGGFVRYLWPKPFATQPVPKLSFVKRFDPWGWIIGTGIYIDDVDAVWRRNATIASSLVLACLIPSVVLSWLTSRSIFGRLKTMIQRFEDVAEGEGDMTKRIPILSNDELGDLGKWFNVFLEKLEEMISGIAQSCVEVSSFSEQLSKTNQHIAANAEETSAQAKVASSATVQVNQNLQTVATGAEEMSASIKEIAKNATEAAKVAGTAVRAAETANTTVSKLGTSSAEIGEVIKVITSIAQQTNLLALNATIEAARAGEAGKGFAVVANEVKELAKKTAKATEDISHKIETIQVDAKSAVDSIGTISQVINEINGISTTIASAVEEQNATTNEMARNVSEAAQSSGQITSNIASVDKAAESTSHGAGDAQKATQQLVETSTELRHLVERFHVGARSNRSPDANVVRAQSRAAHA